MQTRGYFGGNKGQFDLRSGGYSIFNMALTKQDMKEALKEVAKKEDLKSLATKEELKGLATKEDLKELARQKEVNVEFVAIGKKLEGLTEAVNKKPDREEFPQLLDRVLEYTALRLEHEHIKKIIREKLGVEI